MTATCKILSIDKDVCYIEFSSQRNAHASKVMGVSVRGEDVILDYDKKGKIMGIELIGSKKARKPCQEGGAK
jgi:uncharacterized protein YuzE